MVPVNRKFGINRFCGNRASPVLMGIAPSPCSRRSCIGPRQDSSPPLLPLRYCSFDPSKLPNLHRILVQSMYQPVDFPSHQSGPIVISQSHTQVPVYYAQAQKAYHQQLLSQLLPTSQTIGGDSFDCEAQTPSYESSDRESASYSSSLNSPIEPTEMLFDASVLGPGQLDMYPSQVVTEQTLKMQSVNEQDPSYGLSYHLNSLAQPLWDPAFYPLSQQQAMSGDLSQSIRFRYTASANRADRLPHPASATLSAHELPAGPSWHRWWAIPRARQPCFDHHIFQRPCRDQSRLAQDGDRHRPFRRELCTPITFLVRHVLRLK